MREAGQASWQMMSIDEPQNLVLGSFIRDIAALSSTHSWWVSSCLGSGTRGGTTPSSSIRTLLGRR